MYHEPKMCRTCLQMSRGEFKFVSLDCVDPLWESNSPNLKAQLMSLVPEMKIDDTNAYICTACFIALRTAFEFKRMCQATERKFQTHNYKYRRPFGVGPGSPQFHVTLNENCEPPKLSPATVNNNNNIFRSHKLNYLQADTSIDITEHHLYDASRSIPRRAHYISNVAQKQKLPELDPVPTSQNNDTSKKPLNSQELKEKFNLGSQISILQTEKGKSPIKPTTDADLIKSACEEDPYLKANNLGPDALRCGVRIQVLTHGYVRIHTAESYSSLDDIKSISHAYYFGRLQQPLPCQFCTQTFFKRFLFQMHQEVEHADKVNVVKEKIEEEIKCVPSPFSQTNLPRKLFVVKNKIVKFRMRKYRKCCICDKMCVSSLHVLQHCKHTHVPSYNSRTEMFKKIIKTEEPQCTRKLRDRTGHFFVSCLRCSICDKGFVDQSELDVHMYVHTPIVLTKDDPYEPKDEETERQFTCYLCGKSFVKERFLKLHNVQMHLRNKPTTCKNCGRVFKSEFWYERHKCALPPEETAPEEVPDDSNMFPCSFCDRKFSQLRFMKVHRRRSHKFLMTSRGPTDKTSADSPILDSTKDVDPMELYSIAGTSSFGDDAVGADSGSDGLTDAEDHVDSVMEDVEEKLITDNKAIAPIEQAFVVPKIEEKSEPTTQTEVTLETSGRRGRPSLVKDIKPLEMLEPDPGPGRRGNRGMPKIQCDFCGELFDENRYDKHIAEHNKSRLQRRISTSMTHIEEYDSDDFPLKCPVCYKGFKRKYYYNVHINKHIEEGVDVQEEPASPSYDMPATPTPSQLPSESQPESEDEADETFISEAEALLLEEDDIQGEEIVLHDNTRIYVCCGRSFKLKAHFFRHYKIKHPNNFKKEHPIKYAESYDTTIAPIKAEAFNQLDVSNVLAQAQNLPDLTIVQSFGDNKKIQEADLQKISEAATNIKTEPVVPNDLEIGFKEDMDVNKAKRRLSETENEVVKKLKTENAEAVKLRNTVAAHLDDIEILPISSSPSLKYECSQCDKRFKQKSQLRDHQNVHSGEKPYKCDFCQPTHGFTQASSLYFHIRKVHTAVMKNVSWAIQSKNGLCLICLEVFEKHITMYAHLRENYVENGFDCEICSKNVTMSCHYKVHNIDPSDLDSFLLPQESVEVLLTEDAESRASSYTSALDEPDDNLNEADIIMSKARRCEPCGKMFKSAQYFNMHVKSLLHRQKVDFLANAAEKDQNNVPEGPQEESAMNVVNETNASNEIENVDMETMKEIEDNCKEITKKIQRIGTFKCPVCSELFITKTHLRKHRRTKHHTAYAMHEQRRQNVLKAKLDGANQEDVKNESILDTTEDTTFDTSKDEENLSNSNVNEGLTSVQDIIEQIPNDNQTQSTDEVLNKPEESCNVENTENVVEESILQVDVSMPDESRDDQKNEPQSDESITPTENVLVDESKERPENKDDSAKTELDAPIHAQFFEELPQSLTLVKLEKDVSKIDTVTQQEEQKPEAATHLQELQPTLASTEIISELDKIVEKINFPTSPPPLTPIQKVSKLNNMIEIMSLQDSIQNLTPIEQVSEPDKTIGMMNLQESLQILTPLENVCEPNKTIVKLNLQDFPKALTLVESESQQTLGKNSQKYEQRRNSSDNVQTIRTSKISSKFLSPATSQNEQFAPNNSAVMQRMVTPPISQHSYSNQHLLENRGNLHLSPKYYRGEQFIQQPQQHSPVHYASIMARRLSHPYSEYPPVNRPANYYPPPHSTYAQSHNNSYGPFFEQGFVMQEDEMLVKSLSQSEPDSNPEQELLALLHNSNNSMYDLKKCDGPFDSEQEFIDLESAGAKILNQSIERLNKADETGCIVSADSSKPDCGDLLYGRNLSSTNDVALTPHLVNPNQSVDFQGRLPMSQVLNEMKHNDFS